MTSASGRRRRCCPRAQPDAYRYPTVTLTRICRGQGLDTDNLQSALKATRDQVAAWLGLDDGPRSPVRWAYHQESTRAR